MFEILIIAALSMGVADKPLVVAQAKPKATAADKAAPAEKGAAPKADAGKGKADAADKAGADAGKGEAAKGDEAPSDDAAAKEGDAKVAGAAAEGESESTGPSLGETLHKILESGAMGYMIKGGFFMWPILLMAIVSAGVMIERLRTLKMVSGDTRELRERVLELLQEDRPEEALELCRREQGPVPAVLAAGLRKYIVLKELNYDPVRIEDQVIKAMEDYGVHIVAALERHLPILSTIASVAPMVGSVGTVLGMIILFKDIVEQFGTVNIVQAAAAGIQLKLIVTVWGLIVGIPAYVAFNYFTTVINRQILNVEESATELIGAVTLQNALRHEAARTSSESLSTSGAADL